MLPEIPYSERPEQNTMHLRKLWEEEKSRRGSRASLFLVCFKFVRSTLVLCFVIMNMQSLLMMSGAVLTYFLMRAIEGEQPPQTGFAMCALMMLSTGVAGIMQQSSWHISSRAARQLWLALSGLIFEKPALLSSGNRGDLKEGDLVNLMSVDSTQVLNFMQFFAMFSTAPIYVFVPSVVLLVVLGWPFLAGFVVLLGSSFYADRIAKKVKHYQSLKLQAADKRISKLNEAFQGIRTVKLNAWEPLMEARVETERDEEMGLLFWFHVWQSFQQSLGVLTPTLAVLITFILHAQNGGTMDPAIIFACLGLFEFLALGSTILPHMMNTFRQLKNNMERMQKLLIKEDDFARGDGGGFSQGTVRCMDADFQWSSADTVVLRGVSLKAEPGEMVAVCGRVGSGKTTWAGGILGLVSRVRGTVNVSGSSAYVTQSPQILNDTIKANILFGLDMDEEWYAKVLKACALEEDIKQFTAGDETEIGERGITISGGQKQRVAIARAAFSRADVMIFDDPLSAMDAHVGKKVFDNCFRGLLKGHTRIFFTNQLQFCRYCSSIYMLEGGAVAETGTYNDLASQCPPGPFGVFLQSVVGSAGEDLKRQISGLDPSEVDLGELEEVVEGNEKPPSEQRPEMDDSTKTPPDSPGTALSSAHKPPPTQDSPAVARHNTIPGTKSPLARLNTPRAGFLEMAKLPIQRGRSMTLEKKMEGRIGLKDWLFIARASRSFILGVMVLLLSVWAPTHQYIATLLLGVWTNSFIDSDDQSDGLSTPAFIYVVVALALAVTLVVKGVCTTVYFLRSSRKLHQTMLGATLRQSMGWFDTTPVGRVLNRFGNDVMFMDIMLPMLFQMWSTIMGRVLIVIVAAGIIALPAMILAFMLLYFANFIYKRYAAVALDIQRVQMISLSPLLASQSGFLGALDSIRCFDRVDIFVKRFQVMQYNFIKTYYWAFTLDRAVQCIFISLVISLFVGGVSCLLLVLSVYDTPISGLVSPGSAGVILALNLMIAFQAPIAMFMSSKVEVMMAATQRIAEYKDQPIEGSKQPSTVQPPSDWPALGTLDLDNVEMRYQDNLPLVLKGVSLQVAQGEKIGIVGRTGSGKSSVILTCFRMVECAGGAVALDGVDISRVPLPKLRGGLGIIPQDSWLFSGTVRSNLDLTGCHKDDELWEVLRLVQLEKQIRSLQLGLDHEVKEKGENLSAGTAQLLCLARVILKRPRLLFMDEATASVDSETDKLVQEMIRRDGVLPRGCSIVTIAHRLHTVIDYDRIVVLSKGEVVEQGSPHVLLQNESGHLAQFVRDTGESGARELRRRAEAKGSSGICNEVQLEPVAEVQLEPIAEAVAGSATRLFPQPRCGGPMCWPALLA
jgi:ATP-binding cassette subfamily C (CFTR/MRP) protein 1